MSDVITLTVGRILCGQLREYLEQKRFLWPDVAWHEGRGWIERDWTIRANPAHLPVIKRDLRTWMRQLDDMDREIHLRHGGEK